jgi:GTPase SAR1 family protein
MLQACSVLYKYRLPMILVYNKCDISRHEFAVDWMKDFEVFQQAISTDNSYAASLSRSLSLVLDDFYGNMPSVGVSSVTGSGMDDFFKAVDASVDEYEANYFADLTQKKEALMEARRQEEEENSKSEVDQLDVEQKLRVSQ